MLRTACVLATVLLYGAPAAAQNWPSERIERLARWLTAVRMHEPGASDSALYTLASWNNAAIKAVWMDVQTLVHFSRCSMCNTVSVRGVDGRTYPIRYSRSEVAALRALAAVIRERKEDDEILKRAAILHADVVMLAHPEGDARDEPPPPPLSGRGLNRQTPVPDRVVVKSTDGRQDRLFNDAVHWDIAYVLLDLIASPVRLERGGEVVQSPPARDDTARLWYRATSAYLHANAMHDAYHLSRGLKVFPDDPDLHFLNGCMHEALAAPRVQTVLRTISLPSGVVLGTRSQRDELELAEKSFRRVLELRPDHHEARLRLGRVLGLIGRHEQAAGELRQVSDDVDHVALRYYTALFVGYEDEALGRRDEARAAYTRAGDLFPLAQSPQIALSHLARESGDRDRALAAIQRVLDLPAGEMDRRDPFWLYNLFGGRYVDDWLEELYRPFRRKVRN